MAIYAIGDVQGCREQLEHLLEEIRFDPANDTLWFSGDIINRGPDSLGTMQLIYSLRDSIKMVLGNHDLHLLALYFSDKKPTSKDTIVDILESPDVTQYINWLLQQPLLLESDDYMLCHAGIYPMWSLAEARAYAGEVESVLTSDRAIDYFSNMYGNLPAHWSEDLQAMDRYRFITNAFTRMRYCQHDGGLDMVSKNPLAEAPEELVPWFTMLPDNDAHWSGKTLLIGHWASLMMQQPHNKVICLDSGCVWGNTLSAFELTEKRWIQVPGIAAPTYT